MNVVVVGSGIAGLTAALHAHDRGHGVTIVTKGALGGGCTPLAQGGVAGCYGPGDSPAQHAADTLAAGAGLADPEAVAVLTADASARILDLVARGVRFDRAADGGLQRGREAAHAFARVVHAGGDATGAELSRALVQEVRRAGIAVVEDALLQEIDVRRGVCAGIVALVGGRPREIPADAVVLATGGAGAVYARTTNPAGSTGDGIAAALRAGAAVADLEFVQVHPTVLDAPGAAFLVSEAVRGDGAVLVDADGRRFLAESHPDAELAPRDVVARAIVRQAAAQGSPVRLDATALGAELLARRFPTIDRVTRARGFDWSREPIPVTPAAHYLMGGVTTDLDGRTSIPGLLAVGEVARTGIHGANRLASNSLLEGAVFGARAAAALDVPAPAMPTVPPGPAASEAGTEAGAADHRSAPAFTRAALQELMWRHAGLLRTREGLAVAERTLRAWSRGASDPGTVREHEDANLLLVALAMVTAARSRPDSVGAHHLEPEPALIGV
ncbi:L-aspartate oxidase [Microbacterium resistens]|uniref:L-aspartate oxidase n=1 Tax=Microbacterium resistens TaxID=156977 RepID=UPI001C593F02|nr:L-aspartate oxidase [Microbacterium resistens]MBW1638495.1 L-aspartate oxidase [Microbacterium resistens]